MKICAISDLHGELPIIPPCDLLIVAGDICVDKIGRFVARQDPVLQKDWFNRVARPYLLSAPAKHRVVTFGNHDFCGQHCSFASDRPAHAKTSAMQIVMDDLTHVTVGSQTVSIWMSPWSPPFFQWAFMADEDRLADLYAQIPAGIDILVSHGPPYGYGDTAKDMDSSKIIHVGSKALRGEIDRINPKILICGHIHGAYGHYQNGTTDIYNVSVVDERYKMVHKPTMIEFNG